MAIYRGPGGAGDATTDSTSQAIIAVEAAADAEISATAAASSASAAATSATNAATSATNASNSASSASTSATSAASSATAAASSASSASTSATNAASSATAAASSASSASTSATNAATSATNATNSATTASTQATNASNSATTAAASAVAADSSADAAAVSETNAASSASAAATSATNAASSASTASTQATNASNSASAAATSATNASNSASAASTSATNAASSATAAATSASNASTSATNASNSASTAATQATNAANSATAAAASYDSFDDRYLGAKSVAPTLDNDGNTLLVGALYFNTVSNFMKVWDGSSWLDAYASLSGALLAANNLSDLTSVSTARTNLGLGTAALVADNTLVHLAGTETITGAKTFSSTITGSISGNAGTVTNGVYTTGSYADPSWITSIGGSKVSGNISGNAATATTATNQSGGTVAATTGSFSSSITLSAGTANGVAYLNGSKVLTTGSALTFDGTSKLGVGTATPVSGVSSGFEAVGEIWATTAASNANQIRLSPATSGANTIYSTYAGSGSYLPLAFNVSGYEQMRLTSTGLGIGTSSPAYKLDVAGSVIRLTNSGATADIFLNDSGTTNGNVRLRGESNAMKFITGGGVSATLDSSGNLGLGVTPSAWTTGKAIEVGATGSALWGVSASNTVITSNAYYSTSSYKYSNTAPASNYQQYNGQHIFYTAPSGTAGNAISFTQAMTLDANGTLVLGSTTPMGASSSSRGQVSINGSVDSVYALGVGGTYQSYLYTAGSSTYLSTVTSTPLILGTSGTERMRIDSSGNVGIGTSSPASKLSLYGTSGNSAISFIGSAGSAISYMGSTAAGNYITGASANETFIRSDGVGIAFSANTGSSVQMRLDSSGNLQFNSGYGSATTAYGCRAWVNFNGTGTVAIRASGNVSSITDNGTGDYGINFSTAMPDSNYCVQNTPGKGDAGTSWIGGYPVSTSQARVLYYNGGMMDALYSQVAIFR